MKKRYIFFLVMYIITSHFLNNCYALTPDQVIQLKKAGVSDETIHIMLQQERDAKEANPYDQMGVRDIKDREGNTITIYSTGRSTKESTGASEDEKVDKAWKMLQRMIIDNRR
jgi:exopolysaccharide biosynthesis predicted pyruvyltransferase EpsI